MHEDRPPRKKSWVKQWLKRSRSGDDLRYQRSTVMPSSTSQPTQNTSQPVPNRGRSGFFRNIFNTRHTRSAERSQHPVSSYRHSSNHPNELQDPSLRPVAALDTSVAHDTNSAKVKYLDPKKAIDNATKAFADTGKFSGIVRNTVSATDKLQSVPGVVDTIDPIIEPLKIFNSMLNVAAEVHPYAKVVLSIFTCASKMILDQQDRDDAVQDLLNRLSEVYKFMNEDGRLAEIVTMQELYGKVARQTLECADFIVHYSEAKSAWERLRKNIFRETTALIKSYNDAFDGLMQQFRDGAVRDIFVNVHRFAEDMDFNNMIYAVGAGRQTSKRCLPGTREDILSKIKTWIDSTGDDVRPVLWLNGTAGKGKSAIAHTIADWFIERGGPGAFFCFDRTRAADKLHEKIFTTIARDLVDQDPIIRRALVNVVRDKNELRHTTDITRQWRYFILGPVDTAAKVVAAPVLIVIDALDESGDWRSREQILGVLTGQLNQGTTSSNQIKLPANIRILITSRPLGDIHKYLHAASHVCSVSMDDTVHVSIASSQRDIQRYISTRLKDAEGLIDEDFKRLAAESDGLFEWARLACDYISDINMMGQDQNERLEAALAGQSEKGIHLLDKMYQLILGDIMPEGKQRDVVIPRFCSVMGQIIGSLEPLPCTTLTAMRQYFPSATDHRKVEQVIRPLGSLLTGTTDPNIPVRPLHASFYDFLTDKTRSNTFSVDVPLAQRNLAFASLGVLKRQLRFNICSLESSYLPNSAILDLGDRVREFILAELSYSCRFWGTHVSATSIERLLVEEVNAFFDNERLLFWLEVVGLLKIVGSAVAILSHIANWLKDYSEYTGLIDTVMDTRRFLRTFAPAILRSTPHLYLSALPFAPIGSIISKKFAAKFRLTPRVVARHVAYWPSLEKTMSVSSTVYSVAIFPDGKRIACGSDDGTIHIRDVETGEVFGAPLLGHTEYIQSIAISPNGRRIVSGSGDKTIRVWDADTGETLGVPLEGHDDPVCSVAISPNGNRIVSGSADSTIRVWDMDTGKALGGPLKGYTSVVSSVAISPDGSRIVSGSYDNTLRMWDMKTGNALGEPMEGHTDCVHRVVISPDGNYIASSSSDWTIQMWDAITGNALGEPLKGHTNPVVISPDGNFIMSGSHDFTIRVLDARTREVSGMPLQGHTGFVFSIAVSPDGQRVISSSNDNTIRVWDASTRNTSTAPIESNSGAWVSAAISLDGKRIVSCSKDGMIRVSDASTGQALGAPFQGHTDWVWSVAISSDGNRIVSGSDDKRVCVWDAMTKEVSATPLHMHTAGNKVVSVALSSDGTRIVFGSADAMVFVWDLTGNTPIIPLQGHTDWVLSVAISLDGNRIVSGSNDETIRVWDAMTGKALVTLEGLTGAVLAVAISCNGKRIISGSANMVGVWDAYTGKALFAPLQGHTDLVRSVAISLDGNIIVSGSDDRTIRVWNAANGETIGVPLQGHMGTMRSVMSVSISSDGKHIVSCGNDETTRIWDLEFLTQPQLSPVEPPAIKFSSNPIHALCSTTSFLQGFHPPAPLYPNEEGWVVGPDGRLLFWVPASLYPLLYASNMLVAHDHTSQIDLSHFAHGESWHKCYAK